MRTTRKLIIPIIFEAEINTDDGEHEFLINLNSDDIHSQIQDYFTNKSMGDPEEYSEHAH